MFKDREVIAEIMSKNFLGRKKKEKKRREKQFSESVSESELL